MHTASNITHSVSLYIASPAQQFTLVAHNANLFCIFTLVQCPGIVQFGVLQYAKNCECKASGAAAAAAPFYIY